MLSGKDFKINQLWYQLEYNKDYLQSRELSLSDYCQLNYQIYKQLNKLMAWDKG